MVAALAGLAGVLAMIDERVSPVLPGVAIATALNPPIAAIGLCLALGAYEGAWGAFLLFFANVLAILAVAGAMFVIAGFVTRAGDRLVPRSRPPLRRRRDRPAARRGAAHAVPRRHGARPAHASARSPRRSTIALAQEPSTALVSVEFNRDADGVEVLSTVRTPRVIPPERVERIQDGAQRSGSASRCGSSCAASLTKDVTATGSTNLRPYLSLNGRVTEAPLAPDMRLLQQAEQVAREVAATRPEIALLDVELVARHRARCSSSRSRRRAIPRPTPSRASKPLLRERLGDPNLRVVIRRVDSTDVTAKGQILFGAAHFATRVGRGRGRPRAGRGGGARAHPGAARISSSRRSMPCERARLERARRRRGAARADARARSAASRQRARAKRSASR